MEGWRASPGRPAFCGASPTRRPTTAKALLDVRRAGRHIGGFDGRRSTGQRAGLDELFDRQTAESSTEINPDVGIDEITELFVTAMLTPEHDDAEKLQKIGAVALSTHDRRRSRCAAT